MAKTRVLHFLFLALLGHASASPEMTIPPLTPEGRLDRKALRRSYLDGDVDIVKHALEDYFRRPDAHPKREDSLFVYKYLGVMTAADSNTLVLGQSYFTQLLTLAPDIQLTGMYAPERVQEIFQKLRRDLWKELEYKKHHDEDGNLLPSPQKIGTRNYLTWIGWTLSAGAITLVGYLAWQEWPDSKPSDTFTTNDGRLP